MIQLNWEGLYFCNNMKIFFIEYIKKKKTFCSFIGVLEVEKKMVDGGKLALYFLTKNHYMMIIMEYLVPKIEELW